MHEQYPALKRRAEKLLMDHFSGQDPLLLEYLAAYLGSMCLQVGDERIGQDRHDKMLRNVSGLAKVEACLVRTRQEVQNLEPLSKEILSRAIVGIHDFSEFPMGYAERVDQLVAEIDVRLQQLQAARRLFEGGGEWKRKGKGRPKKEAAHMLAHACATIFHEVYDTQPTIITDWDTNKARGPFIDFVTGVFKEFDVSASPEDAARQAVRSTKSKTPLI